MFLVVENDCIVGVALRDERENERKKRRPQRFLVAVGGRDFSVGRRTDEIM